MAWMIVDANYLRSASLREFLASDNENRAVLCDLACVECYKGDSVINLANSTRILSEYPEQVVVLHGNRDLIEMQSAINRTLRRDELIDHVQTNGFAGFCQDVLAAQAGDNTLLGNLRSMTLKAQGLLDRQLNDAPNIARGVRAFAKELDPAFIKRLRNGAAYTGDDFDEIGRHVVGLTGVFISEHPVALRVPKYDEMLDWFYFRYALAGISLNLWWVEHGGIDSISARKLANDAVDMTYVMHATYFDGILSQDTRLLEVYAQTVAILEILKADQAKLAISIESSD